MHEANLEKRLSEMGWVIMATVGAPHSLAGLSKVFSHTDPYNNILNYSSFYPLQPLDKPQAVAGLDSVVRSLESESQKVQVEKYYPKRAKGSKYLARFVGCQNRDDAQALTGIKLLVKREELPDLEEGHYWHDLIGLKVVLVSTNTCIGIIESMLETGSNDVMSVKLFEAEQSKLSSDKKENLLIPWVKDEIVERVDFERKEVFVNWLQWEAQA